MLTIEFAHEGDGSRIAEVTALPDVVSAATAADIGYRVATPACYSIADRFPGAAAISSR
jgi:hypothetical protein